MSAFMRYHDAGGRRRMTAWTWTVGAVEYWKFYQHIMDIWKLLETDGNRTKKLEDLRRNKHLWMNVLRISPL